MITITIEHGEAGARCQIETAPGDPPLRLELPDASVLTTSSVPEVHFNPAAPAGSREGVGIVRRHFWERRPVQLLALAAVLVLALQAGSMLGGLRDVSGTRLVSNQLAVRDPETGLGSQPIIEVPPRQFNVPPARPTNAERQTRLLPQPAPASSIPLAPISQPDLRTATREFRADLAEQPRVIGSEPANNRATGGVVSGATGRDGAEISSTPPHIVASHQSASDLSLFGLKP